MKDTNIRVRGLLNATYPMPLSFLRLFIRSRSRRGFNGKLAYKMLRDRNPCMIQYADKFAVREYVQSVIGDHYLPKLYWSGTNPSELISLELPQEFVVKPNHACGAILIVESGNENRIPKKTHLWGWQPLWTNSTLLDRKDLISLCEHWLSNSFYYLPNKYPEWIYKHIQPRIIVEELLVGWNSKIPSDYKFFVFNGICKMIFTVSNRFDEPKADLYDRGWNRIKGEYVFPSSEGLLERPPLFDEMLRIAEELGSGKDFIRVDLYSTNQGVKFSELTNYPAAAMAKIFPKSLDIWLGEDWVQNY